jgi:methionine synthase II (cobalamin-independent)
VADVVGHQRELGIDIVNDGEYGHSMGERYDYGAWWSYVFPRLGALELTDVAVLSAPQAYKRFTRVRVEALTAARAHPLSPVLGRRHGPCGLGGRVHPQIAWAKLDALAKGAELAGAKL